MSRTMHVKPAPGLKIRYPDAPDRHLPEDGAEVAASSYWMRRLKEGDVVKVSPGARKGGK